MDVPDDAVMACGCAVRYTVTGPDEGEMRIFPCRPDCACRTLLTALDEASALGYPIEASD